MWSAPLLTPTFDSNTLARAIFELLCPPMETSIDLGVLLQAFASQAREKRFHHGVVCALSKVHESRG